MQSETLDIAGRLTSIFSQHNVGFYRVSKILQAKGTPIDATTLSRWCSRQRQPTRVSAVMALKSLETHFSLPDDYLVECVRPQKTGIPRFSITEPLSTREKVLISRHLPADFNMREAQERSEIVAWISSNILGRKLEFRSFQRLAATQRYAFRFRFDNAAGPTAAALFSAGAIDAPDALNRDMVALAQFMTAKLSPIGFRRTTPWNRENALRHFRTFGRIFGALAAKPSSDVHGAGVPQKALSLALFSFPQIWDWYLQWNERRRGFFSTWEPSLMITAWQLCGENGFVRQQPGLAATLSPIDGLITQDQIASAISGWDEHCSRCASHCRQRAREIKLIARRHRDPFGPITPVLDADEPLREYLKVATEILKRIPDRQTRPLAAAHAVRSFLMFRLGLHLGVRQVNLRRLLLATPGQLFSSERQLEINRQGELRWQTLKGVWEVFIPAAAFKNGSFGFFKGRPFVLELPDVGGLYRYIGEYIEVHRPYLLGKAADPRTFFIKTVSKRSRRAEFDQQTFCNAWNNIIATYGIYNPYTRKGAIKGMLPHGPHALRDILATHVLKQTGSYELAGYAIQDAAATVLKYYSRFFPKDKSAIAAKTLNLVWSEGGHSPSSEHALPNQVQTRSYQPVLTGERLLVRPVSGSAWNTDPSLK